MFEPGGVAYVYLCYGIHHLFNIITNTANEPEAILIRAIEPLSGKDHMLHDRNMRQITPALTAGPGRLTQALGITTDDNGTDLTAGRIGIVRDTPIAAEQIRSGKRIGIGYAGPDAELPYRFWIHGHPYVSPAKS
jgi:DNA-3-methyladenine glycosylase